VTQQFLYDLQNSGKRNTPFFKAQPNAAIKRQLRGKVRQSEVSGLPNGEVRPLQRRCSVFRNLRNLAGFFPPALVSSASCRYGMNRQQQRGVRMKALIRVGAWVRKSPFRIYALILTVAALPLGLFLISGHELLLRQVNKKVTEQSTQTGKLVGNLIEQHMVQSKLLLESFASRPSLVESAQRGDLKELTKHLEQAYSLRPDFVFFGFYSPDGTLRAVYPPTEGTLNKSYAFRDWYTGVTKQQRTYVSEAYETAVGDHPEVAIAIPLKSSDGRSIGILMAPMRVETIFQEIKTLTSPQSSTAISIVDQSGHVFGDSKAAVKMISRQQPGSPGLLAQVQAGKPSAKLHNVNGRDLLFGFYPIESLNWGVLIEIAPAAISKALWEYERGLLILGLLIALAAIGVGALVASLYKQLRESEEHTRSIIDTAQDAFIAMDQDGRITEWNPQAEKTFGWSRREALDRDVSETIIPEDTRPSHLEALAHFKRTGHGPVLNKQIEVVGLRRDGSTFPLELSIAPVQRGNHFRFNAFLRDVTESKQYQKRIEVQNRELDLRNREVERANELKSNFLATMSHELRTPLNAIIGFSDLLSEETAGELNEKQKRFVTHVKGGAKHLLQLINDILDLSKIESGHLELNEETFALAELIPEVLSTIRPLAMAKKIELEADAADDTTVRGDRVRLKQVLYNLLSNAIKFTPDCGTVTLKSSREADCVVTSVKDNGLGIAPGDLELIFEEFRQSGGTTKGISEGTGLGLAITKRLVRQHMGDISVTSSPGKGSEFVFSLPYCHIEQAEKLSTNMTSGPFESSVASGTKGLVLVVDDDPAATELLTRILEADGYNVDIAASGAEAVAKAAAQRPDVITLDILMPGGNGFGTLFELKHATETSAIPVIVVSVIDQRSTGLLLGAAEYLMKPIDRDLLLRTIYKYIPRHRGGNLLIVEDDPAAAHMIGEVLASNGFHSEVAINGAEAIRAIAHQPPDAVLLDLMMPGLDGFDVLRWLDQHSSAKPIPVFILTSKDLTVAESEFLRERTRATLHKSSSWREGLLEQVSFALRNRNGLAVGK
jgi:PAS domain S-box-containing protein